MSSEITCNYNIIDNRSAGSKTVARSLLLCIFILIARHTLLTKGRSINELAVVDTHAAIDLTVVSVAALILILSGNLVRTWITFSRSPIIWLGGYYVFCGISFLWSEIPAFTLYRSIEYLILLSATLTAVAQYQNFDTTEKAFCRITVATLIFDILIKVRLHGFSFSLIHWHSATYSISSVILFCYCLGEYLAMSQWERSEAKERSRRLLRYGSFSLFTLALGTSSASNVSAAVGCVVIFLALRRFGWLMISSWLGFLLFLAGVGGGTIRNILFPYKAAE
ncbi:hypothetical protein FJZ33_01625, partial [Candidatus Poribacteria bacterium]|nr:hypothetical protein [Candidatus Poribacteria bacterium]